MTSEYAPRKKILLYQTIFLFQPK